jgi:prophage antirepressor-like protein
MTTAIALFGAFENHDIRWNGNLDQPEWIAMDVAVVLGIKWDAHNLDNYDEDEKGRVTIYTPGGNQELLTVTEPGLYRLVFTSRKPEAKEFRRWVFHEVLPSIRKTGSYSTEPQDPFAHAEVREFLDVLINADLQRSQLRVLCLVRRAEAEGTSDELDYGTIARRLNLHRSTAFRVVASLENAGLMQVRRRRMYQINSLGRLKALLQEAKS